MSLLRRMASVAIVVCAACGGETEPSTTNVTPPCASPEVLATIVGDGEIIDLEATSDHLVYAPKLGSDWWHVEIWRQSPMGGPSVRRAVLDRSPSVLIPVGDDVYFSMVDASSPNAADGMYRVRLRGGVAPPELLMPGFELFAIDGDIAYGAEGFEGIAENVRARLSALSLSARARLWQTDYLGGISRVVPFGDSLFVSTAGIDRSDHRILRLSRDGKVIRAVDAYEAKYSNVVATRDTLVVTASGEPPSMMNAKGAMKRLSLEELHVMAAGDDAIYGYENRYHGLSPDVGLLRLSIGNGEEGPAAKVLPTIPRAVAIAGSCLYWVDEKNTIHATTR